MTRAVVCRYWCERCPHTSAFSVAQPVEALVFLEGFTDSRKPGSVDVAFETCCLESTRWCRGVCGETAKVGRRLRSVTSTLTERKFRSASGLALTYVLRLHMMRAQGM